MLFAADICLQFFHGFFDLGSPRLPVMRLRLVTRAYYGRITNWAPDVLGVIPLFFPRTTSQRVHLVRLLSLLRIWRLRRLVHRWGGLSGAGNGLRVIAAVGVWLMACHWLACLFFLLGWSMCSRSQPSWVPIYWPELHAPCAARAPPTSIVHYGGPSPYTVYVRSLYWALATTSSMGYGSGPTAETDIECLLAIGAQVGGACLSAIIFSNVAAVINKGDATSSRYEAQLESINEFIRFHRLPPSIRAKLHGYHDLLFSINRGFNLERIAAIFPRNVQEDTYFFMYERIVRRVPMFNATDDSFIRALVRLLKPQALLDGDYAFRQGEVGDTMYFVQHGIVQIGNTTFAVIYATL